MEVLKLGRMSDSDLDSEHSPRSSSFPVNIPRSSNGDLRNDEHHGGGAAKSAPVPRRHAPFNSTLIDPLVDESEIVVSSSVHGRSFIASIARRKEAELGDLSSNTRRLYGTLGLQLGDGGSIEVPHELEQSAEITEDYVKIASRNKRAEHATTYVLILLAPTRAPFIRGEKEPRIEAM